MDTEKNDFDAKASTWDEKPERVKLAGDVLTAIWREVGFNRDMDVLDFGCGTGLLTLGLAPLVRSVTGVDSSQGMLGVLGQKISGENVQNVKTLHLDVEKGDDLTGDYHLVVSSMALHHVRDVSGLLRKFFPIVAPGGHICIADLDADDGKFHESNQGVFHNGFDRERLRSAMQEAGFLEVRDKTASGVVKFVVGEGMTVFTVFLMTGRKA
jgi:2-polyprenyl-3-methyl-5-hydroxy-6-metoxy-1,4-benzoquinol methylase